jgi:hypothetical protein
MSTYSLKVLFLHSGIALAYFAVTDFLFVVAKDPNPIGTGLQQWLCIFLHFTITLFVMLTFLGRAADKRLAIKKVLIHTAAIVLVISVSLFLSNPVWDWLWSLR